MLIDFFFHLVNIYRALYYAEFLVKGWWYIDKRPVSPFRDVKTEAKSRIMVGWTCGQLVKGTHRESLLSLILNDLPASSLVPLQSILETEIRVIHLNVSHNSNPWVASQLTPSKCWSSQGLLGERPHLSVITTLPHSQSSRHEGILP